MQITNRLNLPQAMVDACDVAPHNEPHNLSATTLKKGVREIILEKRHWDEMTDDVADRFWALFGTAFHSLMERETPDTFVEEFFKEKVGDFYVTGRLDGYDMKNKIIFDYKTTSVYKILNKDFKDWKSQGLIYAWLLKKQGLEVEKCKFYACLKDWRKSESRIKPEYPQAQVYCYEFDVTESELEEIEKFIFAKVDAVAKAENLPDAELPLCTDEERWAKPKTYAVMKKGRKTAIRVFDDKSLADALLKSLDDNHYIEERKGSDGKCDGYCGCCEFCSYWQENYANKDVKEAV